MKLKYLHLVNFLSHKDSYIDFDKVDRITMIVGQYGTNPDKSNGAGKTSIIEAILYALFEKSRISDNKMTTLNELVRRESDGQMSVELVFELNGHLYRITRTRDAKKNKGTCDFEVQTDSGWKSKRGDRKNSTNREIVDTIGIDYKTFTASICFQQEEVDKFVKATGEERKEIIKDILQLGRYEEYKLIAKAKLDVVKDELKVVEKHLDAYNSNPIDVDQKEKELLDANNRSRLYIIERENLNKQLEKLRRDQILFNEQVEKRNSLHRQITERQSTLKRVLSHQQDALTKQEEYGKLLELKKAEFTKLEQEYEKVKDEFTDNKADLMSSGKVATKRLKEVEAKLEEAQKTCFSIEGELASKDKDIEGIHSHKEGSKCPTCFSPITEQSKKASIVVLEESKGPLKSRLQMAKDSLEVIKAEQRKTAAEVEGLKDRVTAYNQWIQKKNHLKERLVDIKEAGSNAKAIVEDQKHIIKENKSVLEQYEQEIVTLEKEYSAIIIDSAKFEELNKKIAKQNDQYEEVNNLLTQTALTRGRLETELRSYKESMQMNKEYTKQREQLVKEKFYYTQLTEMFGKEIPSLIIENSCVELELIANEILSAISDLSIKFITQQATQKGDMKEVFEIQVKKPNLKECLFIDNLSNGEKFRVVFAIRVAMSRLLVRRRGSTQIEFLFYDECFSSLDNQGIDQVIDIFRHLRQDFRHQLVITHRTDLKERFGSNIILVENKKGISKVAV